MSDFISFPDPEEDRERRMRHIGRRIMEACAEHALAGDEVYMQLMERFAPYAAQNGNQDLLDAYRAGMRRKMN
jgi:hypothetical protein